jgi:hypothetical protein
MSQCWSKSHRWYVTVHAQWYPFTNELHVVANLPIPDTIFNHMAGIDSGTGVAGSSFTHYNYPGIYQSQVSFYISIVGIATNGISSLCLGFPPLRPYTWR